MKHPLLLLPLLLLLPSAAFPAQATGQHTYTVIINNTCNQDIRVAVHYRHPELGWVTEGWWQVAARSEQSTGLVSSERRFYMFGDAPGPRQWPPSRSRKQYNHYDVLEDGDFRLVEGRETEAGTTTRVPFSLKEVSVDSAGLKARFDC